MRFFSGKVLLASAIFVGISLAGTEPPIKPRVFIIDMFVYEAEAWYGIPEFNILAQNITIPGLSPVFPDIHCTPCGEVCQLVTGEAEINAAASVAALTLSPRFDLRNTYFLIAGIAGVNPEVATMGSVTFARYAVQVALQYEFDSREAPANWNTGYVPQGSTSPTEFPQELYGTEVFEMNDNLRQMAMSFARTAVLNDSDTAVAYRANYNVTAFAAGANPPAVVGCDVATSDAFFSGKLLGDRFKNTTTLFTNGSGIYCTTAQEDNATLESLMRAAVADLVDFSRVIVMRTASDFDRGFSMATDVANLFNPNTGGFGPSIMNIYLAGIKIVMGILEGWDATFEQGVKPSNYIGDIFGSLGGTPDFGPGNMFGDGNTVLKRSTRPRRSRLQGRQ